MCRLAYTNSQLKSNKARSVIERQHTHTRVYSFVVNTHTHTHTHVSSETDGEVVVVLSRLQLCCSENLRTFPAATRTTMMMFYFSPAECSLTTSFSNRSSYCRLNVSLELAICVIIAASCNPGTIKLLASTITAFTTIIIIIIIIIIKTTIVCDRLSLLLLLSEIIKVFQDRHCWNERPFCQ